MCQSELKTTDTSGRKRVVIEGVAPEVDGGRYPIKRVLGGTVVVQADAFTDGHDLIACVLLYRPEASAEWQQTPMRALPNDRWEGQFPVSQQGRYRYTVRAWTDAFASWRRDLSKRAKAGEDLGLALRTGAEWVEQAAARAPEADRQRLIDWAQALRDGAAPVAETYRLALNEDLARVIARYPDLDLISQYPLELTVVVDRERARYSSWYELFPRSCAAEPGRHGSLRDCEARLPYIAALGFDVLYLPPIHPVGRSQRKGRNNAPTGGPDDVGSPWGIGAVEGGHEAVHPQLGTLEDFRRLLAKAQEHGLELALDIAFQCAPDHPWVQEHPQWFRWRPDGTVQYAENPPKKYQDIYPFDFETQDWRALWQALKGVVEHWIGEGVRIFRIDNPHTKPFPFWEWLITEVKATHPEVLFLAEAFTRPKVMHRLAKLGFTQSYTYFTWRNAKQELIEYFTELTQGEGREYFRPNLWPNTPDILSEYLQCGGRPAFVTRLVLAGTLGASYGIYGPAFELMEADPMGPGSEEYLNSEKYQLRAWDLQRPDSLKDLIARVNRIRRENPALHADWGLRFHEIDNDQLLAYSKVSDDLGDSILVIANLDPYHSQAGWIELPLEAFGIDPRQSYQMHDLLSDTRYIWYGPRNYVELDPQGVSAHIFRLRRRVRSERDFEYFL